MLSLGARPAGRPGRMTGFPTTVVAIRKGRPGECAGLRRDQPLARVGRSVPVVLHGRDAERARLAALLDDARGGRAGTLLLHGEPGVGKSALLEDLVANAGSDVRVLRTQGVESEAPLAFAALHRLLRPVLGTPRPAPGPAGPRAAGRVRPGGRRQRSQPFLVALATLSMLTEAAEDAPVLCVVDDAQWLDQATADAVLVASRRLGADRVAVVFAARDGEGRTFAPDDVPSRRR